MTLKIYLADLTYDTVKTNYVIPLNIGYIASYTKDLYKDKVDLTLFKHPKELEHKLKTDPPDVLALSFYSWNDQLDRFFIKISKDLNPQCLTIMGGPNTGVSEEEIERLLTGIPELDYYVLNEGEVPFANLIGEILKNGWQGRRFFVPGCSTLTNDGLKHQLIDFKKSKKEITLPSPYLTGFMDPFIADPDMIPLLETNRGCPYECVYCQWGSAALSKIKTRSIDEVYEELDYLVQKSAGQKTWIFCDANFGILKRDFDIAYKIREIKNENSFPATVVLWHSKNTTKRNIDISEVIGDEIQGGYVAIQSSDEKVLKLSGRGSIKLDSLKEFVNHYKDRNLKVSTDLLIGLPGETAASHLQSICDAFSIGFTNIDPINIRLLGGTVYESKEYIDRYQVKVKYRPMFGMYGKYDGQKVFEMESSVRSTVDMSETELNSFKILHWLIYLAWNSGLFANQLKFAQKHDLNPGKILYELSETKEPTLRTFFDDFLKESMEEWFDTDEEIYNYFQKDENFEKLINNFAKINYLNIARIFQDPKILKLIKHEIEEIIKVKLSKKGNIKKADEMFKSLSDIEGHMICQDPLQGSSSIELNILPEVAKVILDKEEIPVENGMTTVRICRTEKMSEFCKQYFEIDKEPELNNWLRFLESGGLHILTNKIELCTNKEFQNSFEYHQIPSGKNDTADLF